MSSRWQPAWLDARQPGGWAVVHCQQQFLGDTNGVLYARNNLRWATTGMELAKISGTTPRRTGALLGP